MKLSKISPRKSILQRQLQALSLSLGLLTFGLVSPVMAQQQQPRTLSVMGRGVERISTTIAQVQLGVEVQGQTAANVQQELARRSSAVVELLRSRNVERLETTGISLRPNYNYESNVQRLVGYVGTNTVSFRIDPQRAGTLLDEAVSAGATRIDNISFIASDSAIATAQQQALRGATQDAQRQADAVFGALNLTRRDIVSIQINNATPPPVPLPRPMFDAAVERAASTPVVAGEQQVEAWVTLQISY